MRRGTHTVTARELTSADAASEYASKSKDVKGMISRLEKALKKEAKEFKDSGSTDRGYVGNIGHVYSELVDLVEFVGG